MVPGCAAYDEKVDQPGGFVLPAPAARLADVPDRGRTRRSSRVSPLEVLHVPEGRLLLQTLRSHDQFNTTIYGLDDRYRGISNGRRVVFVHPDDIAALGVRRRRRSSTSSASGPTARERPVPAFRVVAYDTPRGCAAAYYPETNPLVPLDSTATGQQLPDLQVGDRPAAIPTPDAISTRRAPVIRSARTRATSPTSQPHQLS